MGPIARIRTDLPQKFGIPRNGSLAPHLHGEIRFEPEFASAAAVAGLEEFSHLWLIWQFENGLAGETQRVETTAGLVTGWRMGKRLYRIRLNDPCHMRLDGTAEVDGITYDCAYVELGDPGIPHAAVPIAGLRDYDAAALLRLGRTLRHYPDFPKGANVNFYEIIGPDHVYERTYERGVEDFTYACGTGTGSVVTVLTLLGKVSGKHVRVDMTGGTLYVDVERNAAGRVTDLYLTGPTNVVCKGEITDENLVL